MEDNKKFEPIQRWEYDLARIMCGENISLLQEKIHLPNVKVCLDNQEPQKQQMLNEASLASYEEFLKQRREILKKAIDIIREVQVDSNGNRILTPQEWLDKTATMTDEEKKAFSETENVRITDIRKGYSYDVPMSLADNFKRLLEVGIRQTGVISGRVVDQPNYRDSQGFPIMLSGLGRPLVMLNFDIRHVPGSLSTIDSSQMQDIILGAREAGWKVENWDGKGLSIMLPLTKSGLTFEQVSEKVYDKLYEQDTGWRTRPDWLTMYSREYKNIVRQEGGRVLYSDRDIADAWNRLTDAIVNNVRMRWQRENPRISDIQVTRKVDRDKQTVQHIIRCRIDGDMQISVPLHSIDGGRYDTAVHVGDTQKLDTLKRELAATYFSDELRIERTENHSMKR